MPQKIPTSEFVYPKKSLLFLAYLKKSLSVFASANFIISSGKLKHANFNFGFAQKQNYKLCSCYFLFELMKNTIPKKSLCCFRDPKKSLLAKMSHPKKSFGLPPSLKYLSAAPGFTVFSLNFSSAGKGPFIAGKAENMHQRCTFLGAGG